MFARARAKFQDFLFGKPPSPTSSTPSKSSDMSTSRAASAGSNADEESGDKPADQPVEKPASDDEEPPLEQDRSLSLGRGGPRDHDNPRVARQRPQPRDLPSDNHQQQFEPSADPWEGQQRFNSVRNHNDTGLGLGSGPHQGYYENTKTFLERHERATKVLKGNEDDDVAAVAVRRHDSPHEGFDTPPKAPTPRRTHARTVSAGSKRSIEEFEADQDEYVNEGVGSAQTVHLANSSNLLDNLTPVKTDKEVLSVTDNGQVGEKEKGLRALMYFRRHLILPQDIDALISRQCESGKPTSRLVAKKHLATATRWQGQILKWVRAQVKSIYDANAPDMLEWEGAKRYDAYTQFFEQDPLGHAKKMWGGGITSYVDFDAIIEPPEGLSPDLRQLLDRWARYLFHCWLKAADASFIFQVAKQHKPDHPELVEATTGKEKLDEFIIWRTMTLNEDMDVPGIKDVPIIVRDRTMHG